MKVLFPPCLVQPSLAGSSTSVVLPKSAPSLSSGKTQTRGLDTRVEVATHQVFHIGEPVSPSSLSFPLKEKSQHGYLQRFIYYGTGVVQAWSQGRGEGGPSSWRTRRTWLPHRAPPQGHILGGIPGIKAQTKRNKAASASPSSRHPGWGAGVIRGRFPKC